MPTPTILIVNIFGFRHGNAPGESLDDLGKRQIVAARDAHLNGLTIHGIATSDIARARESGSIFLGDQTPDVSIVTEDLSHKWTDRDHFLCQWLAPRPDPANVFALLSAYPPAVARRTVIRRFIERSLIPALFFPAGSDDPIRPTEERTVLIVSHYQTIETIVENSRQIPPLQYGDGFRMRVRTRWHEGCLAPFLYEQATHLPCPIQDH